MKKRYLVIGIILSLVCMGITPSYAVDNIKKSSTTIFNGNTLYVGGNGTGNYTTIQDAIDNASDGDTVLVYPNTYKEPVRVNKQLFIKGITEDEGNIPTINGETKYDVVIITADNCLFENFKVRNEYLGYSYKGITLKSNYNIIKNCTSYDTGYDIFLQNASYNLIHNNELYGIHNCIKLTSSSNNNTIYENNIYGNGDERILISGNSNNNVFYNNTINSSKYSHGVAISGTSNNVFIGNIISSNNRKGMLLENALNVSLINNTFINNELAIYGENPLYWSSHIIENNTVNGEPLRVYINSENVTISSDTGQVILYNCSNLTIENLNIHDVEVGIYLKFCSRINIINNTINSNHYRNMDEGCIHVVQSSNITISENEISNSLVGIYMISTSGNIISGNIVRNQDRCIWLEGLSYSKLSYNNVSNCRIGIGIHWTTGNEIFKNKVSSCFWECLLLFHGNNNSVFENVFSKAKSWGIKVVSEENSLISRNIVKKNKIGIYVDSSSSVKISDNNFLLNLRHAYTEDSRPIWLHNYWGRPRIGPKIIVGKQHTGIWDEITFPLINFDWHPARKPYNIEG